MKSPVVIVAAVILAPLALALTAFFSGLWQSRSAPARWSDEELGT